MSGSGWAWANENARTSRVHAVVPLPPYGAPMAPWTGRSPQPFARPPAARTIYLRPNSLVLDSSSKTWRVTEARLVQHARAFPAMIGGIHAVGRREVWRLDLTSFWVCLGGDSSGSFLSCVAFEAVGLPAAVCGSQRRKVGNR